MDPNEQVFRRIEREFGASLLKAKPESFIKVMSAESLEDCMKLRLYFKSDIQFYKNVLAEEHRAKNPNSFRYRDADNNIKAINEKGKLLKSIIDQKSK